jgi:hypothetical protein
VGEYQIARHEFLLREAAKRHGRLTAREQIDQAAAAWNPDKPLIEVYREATSRLHADLRKAGLVTLPQGDALKVLPVPPFLKHQFPTAAYSAPEPFSKDRTGIFWVNDLSLDQNTPARRAAEIRQHHGLDTILTRPLCKARLLAHSTVFMPITMLAIMTTMKHANKFLFHDKPPCGGLYVKARQKMLYNVPAHSHEVTPYRTDK